MLAKVACRYLAFWVALLYLGQRDAAAQLGSVGSNARTQLNLLNDQSIGRGFSGGDINRQELNFDSNPNIEFGQLGVNYSSLGPRGGAPRPAATAQNRPATFGGGRPASKPFSSASQGPTVSPYLNLFREDFDGSGDLNYNTLVRPQLQQQQFNQDLQRQSQAINQRVQQLSAQQAFNPAGSEQQAPTGHTTVFQNLSHYYPQRARAQK